MHGGRGETRRQATAWQADRTKAEWADRAARLEDVLRDVIAVWDDAEAGELEVQHAIDRAREALDEN